MDVCEYCGKNIVQLITKRWVHIDGRWIACNAADLKAGEVWETVATPVRDDENR